MSAGEERISRAAEYVLGLMDEAQLERFEQELAQDAELAREVAFWADRFDRLQDDLAPEAASDSLWQRISARIDREDAAPKTPATPCPARAHRQKSLLRMAERASGRLLAGGVRARLSRRPDHEAGLRACRRGGAGPTTTRFPAPSWKPMGTTGSGSFRCANSRYRRARFWKPGRFTTPMWVLCRSEPSARRATWSWPGRTCRSPQPDQLYEITLEDAPGSPVGRPLGPILVKGLAVEPPR